MTFRVGSVDSGSYRYKEVLAVSLLVSFQPEVYWHYARALSHPCGGSCNKCQILAIMDLIIAVHGTSALSSAHSISTQLGYQVSGRLPVKIKQHVEKTDVRKVAFGLWERYEARNIHAKCKVIRLVVEY